MGLQLLEREVQGADINEDAQDALMESKSACELSINILNELLDYEKLEAGIMTLSLTEVKAWGFLVQVMRPFHLQVTTLHTAVHSR